MNLKEFVEYKIFRDNLYTINTNEICIINTLNAHSFCLSKNDIKFSKVLQDSDILLPDGSSIILAAKVLENKKIRKIAGADIHQYLLEQAELKQQKVFYLGASDKTLKLIGDKIGNEYPNVEVGSFSPPFATKFSEQENLAMISAVNAFEPNILFVGMTAPKQEKWVFDNKDDLNAKIICSIGAVFDFYAGNINRAPHWMIKMGMEWLYRLIKEPKRMWKRYLINNTKFLIYVFQEKYF